MKKQLMNVVRQKKIAKDIYELTLSGSLVKDMINPGQFVHLKVSESTDPLLRRPISICNIDQEKEQFTMIYRAEGRGTTLLSEKKIGDIVDVLGPLGNGFPVYETAKGEVALLVGGGIGVPPLYELSKQLTEKGVKVIHVLGFQSEDVTFYEEEFSELGETHIATVDGTCGACGFVTDVIKNEQIEFDTLYSCGPTAMLKALEDQYSHKKGFISLEERMACAIGACFACVHHTKADPTGHSYKRVCTEGPVFKFGEVVL